MKNFYEFTLLIISIAVTLVLVPITGEVTTAPQSSTLGQDQSQEIDTFDVPSTSNLLYLPLIRHSPLQKKDVQLILSDTSVFPGEPVTVTVINNSTSTIATFDTKSLCSIFTIQTQIENDWEEVLQCGLAEPTRPVTVLSGESLSLEFNGGSHFLDPGALDQGVYLVKLLYKEIDDLSDLISEEVPWQTVLSPELKVDNPIPSGSPRVNEQNEDHEIEGPFVSDPSVPNVFEGDLRELPIVGSQPPSGTDTLQFDIPNPNFDGLSNPSTSFITPPDTVADVGPNHIIQAVNVRHAIYDKVGNLLAGPFNINSLWAGFGGPCETFNNGDPAVVYDHLADRWLLSQFVAFTNQCIAISRTSDPVSGGWFLYDFLTGVTNDYPKFGLWPDAYYMGTQRGYLSNTLFGADAWAFDRANMLLGAPATFIRFFDPGAFMLPSELDGSMLPPSGAPNIFARFVDGAQFGGVDRLELRAFSVNFGMPMSSTFTSLPDIPTAAFDRHMCNYSLMSNCIPQPGTGTVLESLTAWLLHRLQYRNFGTHETLLTNHTIDVDGADHAGIRWYELRKSGSDPWTIFQQADYSPDDNHRWMGSIAMDKVGNIALGYSVSSNTVFPSLRYAGRESGDPLGTLPQGEFTIIAGNGSQTGSFRWGDYSAMVVDPLDDCTYWFTSEYYESTSPVTWNTRISAFAFDSCLMADLAIIKSDTPDPVTAGDDLTYTLTVTNSGPSDASGVSLTDTLPAGVTLVSATPSQGSCSGSVTCDLGNLANGASAKVTIVATVDPATPCGPITNAASVSGNKTDPDPSNNAASEDTTVQVELDMVIDFEGPSAGSIVDGVSVSNGISVVAGNCPVSGTVSVLGINTWFLENAAMIYDSTNPTGGDDNLAGFMDNKNLLIISEDLDSADPDDNRRGGIFEFDFANFGPGEVSIQSMEVFDIEPHEFGGTIVVEKIDASEVTTAIPITGNHSKDIVSIIDGESVKRVTVTLIGSGAIDNIRFLVLVQPETP